MAIAPATRTAGLVLGTAVSSSITTVMWMSSHEIDLYAIVGQLNSVAVDIAKLVTTISTIVAGVGLIWKSTVKNLAADVTEIAKTPGTPLKGLITEDTPAGRELAKIPGPVVVAGTPAAQVLAQ